MSAPPAGVVSIASDVDVHGYPSSFAFWLLIPDDDVATIPYWSALITSYQLQVWPAILNCMHSGASFVTCRIAAGGTAPQRFVEAAPANHGAWTGGQAQSVAAGLYVLTSSGHRGSGSRVHFPAVPDIFIDDNARLSNAGRGLLQQAATALVDWIASVSGPTGAQVLLGTLQTRRGGVPLLLPTFDPAVAVLPTARVERMGRRLPRRGRVSPT